MKRASSLLLKSLAFRTISPIVLIALLSWISLYIFVLRSVSRFADDQIRESFSEMAHDIYLVCDRSLNELYKTGTYNEENTLRIKKALALNMIGDFMRQNRLAGMVMHQGEILFTAEGTQKNLSDAAAKINDSIVLATLTLDSHSYYAYRIRFEPWKWDITMIKDSGEYAALLRNVKIAYSVTGLILTAVTLLFIYSLRRNIRYPLNSILEPISKGKMPDYTGITEFENLSSSIRSAMELRDRETLLLNNIYHLAAVKRGGITLTKLL